MKKQHVTGINFTSGELLTKVKAAAKADGRSFSSYVCRVLERGLAQPVGTLNDATKQGATPEDTGTKCEPIPGPVNYRGKISYGKRPK